MNNHIVSVRLDAALLANLAILLKRAREEHPDARHTVSSLIRGAVAYSASSEARTSEARASKARPNLMALIAEANKSSPGE